MPVATLRNGKRFEVDASASVLSAALGQGIALEYSCRTGRCGVCKAKVMSGDTIAIQHEEGLTVEDAETGHILTCCRSVQSDVTLDIEDLGRLAGQRSYTVPARIAEIGNLTSTVVRVTLRFPPGASIQFLPGQYIDVIARGVRRSYSIANAPRADRTITLDIRKVEGGILSRYWFGEAATGDLVRVELPLGTFFLRDSPAETIVFLATGTGIAPVRAMIEEITANPAMVGDAQLLIYWGNRHAEDFYWEPPVETTVTFHPVLSRPTDTWAGRTGYIQDALLSDGVTLETAIVYACGSQSMIDAAGILLQRHGLPQHHYHFDAFVSSAPVE